MPNMPVIRRQPDTKSQSLANGIAGAGSVLSQGLNNIAGMKLQQQQQDQRNQILQQQAQQQQMAQQQKQQEADNLFKTNVLKFGQDVNNREIAKQIYKFHNESTGGSSDQLNAGLSQLEQAWNASDNAASRMTISKAVNNVNSWYSGNYNRLKNNIDIVNGPPSSTQIMDDIKQQWPAYRANLVKQVAQGGTVAQMSRVAKQLDQEALKLGILKVSDLPTDEDYKNEFGIRAAADGGQGNANASLGAGIGDAGTKSAQSVPQSKKQDTGPPIQPKEFRQEDGKFHVTSVARAMQLYEKGAKPENIIIDGQD